MVGAPLHTTWLATGSTIAVGFTVYVKVAGVPAQVVPALVYDDVTVIVAVTGAVVTLVADEAGYITCTGGLLSLYWWLCSSSCTLYWLDVIMLQHTNAWGVPPQGSAKVVLVEGMETLV